MKKISLAVMAVVLGCAASFAGEATIATSTTATTYATSQVSIPTGVFFNGGNFIKVESSWVRICVGGQSRELSIRNAQMDPSGNYALVLDGGESITIYSNGRTLYYNGSTYSKK